MRYVVIGAGAVGGTIGVRLHEAGRDVVLVARGPHLAAIREHGLRFDDPERSRTVRVPVAGTVAEVAPGAGDVVVLAVKSQDTAAVLDELAPGVPVVCAQNGVANEREAHGRGFPTQAMLVILPAEHYEPGVVVASSVPVPGVLDVGTHPTGTDELSEKIAADLTAAGFSSRADPHVMDAKYGKLLTNLANAADAICGADDPAFDEVAAAARAEGADCLAAAGVAVRPDEDDRVRREGVITESPVGGLERRGSSMWQSLRRGTGRTEAAFLNGEVVALGAVHGVPTPVNAELLRVVTEMGEAGEPPASRDGAGLLAAATAGG
ncbi:ketopantoate reductase family protein [Pseudonocardia endophytica]|uniref:2-dehydropantoate 2-reductase n=1 Tax=Pseudonocardia endophytica TaxID=401976 RepID=A0A4R1I1F2_PSEEN|nr:2-dehydropantoate 2-reductase [Pseudonocardia endophytica]TCK27761.1 2-dehydropantoate 2-reductase [Pseudonocardia endophytica]